jgi:soluble lytic murein transglycosylase-like protein
MATWSKTATFAALVAVTLAPSVQRWLEPGEPEPDGGRPRAEAGPAVVRAGAESMVLPSVLPMPEVPVYSEAAKDPALIADAFEAVAAARPATPLATPAEASPRLANVAALAPAKPQPATDDKPEPARPSESPSRAALEDLVRKEAAARGMPAEIAFAVVSVESGWDAHKKGDNGGIGLLQVVPRIARQFGFKGRDAELWAPAANVKWGMAYVGGAYKKAGGDLCRTAMKISGGHYVEEMKPYHRAYCDKLKAAMASVGPGAGGGETAKAE